MRIQDKCELLISDLKSINCIYIMNGQEQITYHKYCKKELYICVMSFLSNIQDLLRRVKPGLSSKYHVNTLGLFGSVVRNDFTAESDIDIVVDFSKPIGIEFIDLANELETLLNRKVDLVSKDGIKPKYFREIQPEIIYV
jgi:uncharacterized protein